MNEPEDRLRAALRDEEPGPLDADAIMSGARRRRLHARTRFAAVAAAAVVVLAGGWQVLGPLAREAAPTAGSAARATYASPHEPAATAPEAAPATTAPGAAPATTAPGAAPATTAPGAAPATTGGSPAVPDAAQGRTPAPGDTVEVIPGRTLGVRTDQWCLVDSAGRDVDCAARDQPVQRVRDAVGDEWLVVLAPSGPRTRQLQAEQPGGWVDLETSPVPGDGLWVGVAPGAQVPAAPSALRALDGSGTPIWHS